MATILAERAANDILMSERSVVAFEQEIYRYFDIAKSEIRQIVLAFFSTHQTNGRVMFGTLNLYLNDSELFYFKKVIESWLKEHDDADWAAFAALLRRLLQRKRITYKQEVLLRIQHAVETAYLRERQSFLGLAALNVAAAYYSRYYDVLQFRRSGLSFVPLSEEDVQKVITAKWDDTKVYGNFATRNDNNATRLQGEYGALVPQSLAAARSAEQTIESLQRQLEIAYRREKALIRTEINEVANAANLLVYKSMNIERYRYVAILDEVTTVICQNLNGKLFYVSQAQQQVNYPPMHTNCRSTTEPDLTSVTINESTLVQLSRTETIEDFVREYAPAEDVDDILNFFSKYRK